jgi:hypothetical protein
MRTVQFSKRALALVRSVRSTAKQVSAGLRPTPRAILAVSLAFGGCASIAACASTPPYNPYHLETDQIAQVGEICQTMLGFKPSEGLTDNLWPGNPDPEAFSNRYRGCIATLSSSLRRAVTARAARQAERDCTSRGFAAGSSDMALCVLTAQEAPMPGTPVRLTSSIVTPFLTPTPPTFNGPVPAKARKEQVACAEVGLDPNEDAFASCVQGLKSVSWTPFFDDSYHG